MQKRWMMLLKEDFILATCSSKKTLLKVVVLFFLVALFCSLLFIVIKGTPIFHSENYKDKIFLNVSENKSMISKCKDETYIFIRNGLKGSIYRCSGGSSEKLIDCDSNECVSNGEYLFFYDYSDSMIKKFDPENKKIVRSKMETDVFGVMCDNDYLLLLKTDKPEIYSSNLEKITEQIKFFDKQIAFNKEIRLKMSSFNCWSLIELETDGIFKRILVDQKNGTVIDFDDTSIEPQNISFANNKVFFFNYNFYLDLDSKKCFIMNYKSQMFEEKGNMEYINFTCGLSGSNEIFGYEKKIKKSSGYMFFDGGREFIFNIKTGIFTYKDFSKEYFPIWFGDSKILYYSMKDNGVFWQDKKGTKSELLYLKNKINTNDNFYAVDYEEDIIAINNLSNGRFEIITKVN